MSGQRQKNRPEQGRLAFPAESRSDAPMAAVQGTETLMAKHRNESLAGTERLMEEVRELENCKQALQRVKANKGSPGSAVGHKRTPGVPEAAWAGNRGTAAERNLSTAAGQAGGNPEAGRRGSAQVQAFLVCWIGSVQEAVLQVLQKH